VEIQDIKFHRVAVPRIYNTKVAPMGGHEGGKSGSEYLLIELMSGGAVGLGEISDIESDWGAVGWDDLQNRLRDALVGGDLADRDRLVETVVEHLPLELHRELQTAIRAAIETSLLDVTARSFGVPVYDMLGGRKRSALPISWVAFIGNEDGIDQEIQEKVDAGFSTFKLKVGADHASDLERIKTTRRIAGPEAHVRVDASGEWDVDEAIEKLKEMHALEVNAVETPIKAVARSVAKNAPEQVNENAEDVAAELAQVRSAVQVRVIEHISDFDDGFALALAKHQSVDVFNVMPGQAGGVFRAQKLIHLAEMSGIDVLLGSTVELSPGTAISLHLGLSSTGVTEACDLVGPGLLVDDVCEEPLTYVDGKLTARPVAGLGVDLSEEKLEKLKAIP
jgi:L-alanine-DL-glutamate epimerase-like enolase superfamily enzyme